MRPRPNHITQQLFKRLYVEEKKSVLQIGKIVGKSIGQVSRYLKIFGVPTRPFSTKGMKVSLGMKRSLETRRRISESKKGEKSPTWKGGITPLRKKMRSIMELKLWRQAVLKRDDKTCQLCGLRKEKGMEIDHIKPFSQYPELRTSIENGRVLCNPCHRTTDTYGSRLTS